MTTPTFTPPTQPAVDYESETQFRTLEADFGDGYSQRAGDGLNNVSVEPRIRFASITGTQKDTIMTFMTARKGYEAFYFTLPDEITARKFTCSKPNKKHLGNDLWDVTLDLKEVFDL